MKRIINCETGEIIERELNEDELAQLDADIANSVASDEAQAEKAEAKAAVIAKLGLTDYEVAALLA